ncbi:PilX N-terminal domain-containing pilus assembly protein [Neisseria sp. WLZKY-1]|jgi:hypothetical protein|uniref:pilus assembly PilX family protein n=1 Tax=Neisseria sp. WLZKY-1 TaxID=3390377 RepID=UPI00397BC40F
MKIIKQRGFSLPVVMVMMLVLAVMVLAAAQSFNTESRISSNDADRKMAMQVAESALRGGEAKISSLKLSQFPTVPGCSREGLCMPGDKNPVWEGSCDSTQDSCWESRAVDYVVKPKIPVSRNPKYLIERIGKENDEDILRVTVRAWGENKNTVVMLQSYVAATLD